MTAQVMPSLQGRIDARVEETLEAGWAKEMEQHLSFWETAVEKLRAVLKVPEGKM